MRWVVLCAVVFAVAAMLLAWRSRLASAAGAPAVDPLVFTGTLTEDGMPVNDPDGRQITLRLYAAADAEIGTETCLTDPPGTTVVAAGRFRIALNTTCVDDLRNNPERWIEVAVDGTPLQRMKVGAVPYALEADSAIGAGGALEARLAEIEDGAFCPRLVGQDRVRHVYEKDLPPTGVVRCTYGSDKMVKVGAFWIDQYEAVLVDNNFWNGGRCDDGTDVPGVVYGSAGGASPTDDYPVSAFPDNGNWSRPVYACSISGRVPSRMMTWFQAQAACAVSGKRLCTNAEWQAAVEGTNDPVGSHDGSEEVACHTGGTAPRETGQAGTEPAVSASCISRWGAEDMIGNLWEWVADWGQAGPTRSGMTDGASATPWPAAYNADTTGGVNGRAYSGTAYTDGLPAAALRGGNWNAGPAAGAFALYLYLGPSYRNPDLGVRCCAGVP